MANTLQNLFPFTHYRAEDFNVFPCVATFAASVSAGKYVFNKTSTPPVNFGKLLQKQTGVIAGVMVSANCTEAQFSAAVDAPLMLQILHGGNLTPVNMRPFPFSNFSMADNFQLQWECSGTTLKQEEDFLLQVEGAVNQVTGMTQNELILQVCFNFIRVGSDKIKIGPDKIKG